MNPYRRASQQPAYLPQPQEHRRPVVLLLANAAAIAWYSWEDEKAAAVQHLATITELEAKAFDGYFTHLENDRNSLGAALTKEGELIDLDQAYERVRAFREAHSELYNATLILADGSLEVGFSAA